MTNQSYNKQQTCIVNLMHIFRYLTSDLPISLALCEMVPTSIMWAPALVPNLEHVTYLLLLE